MTKMLEILLLILIGTFIGWNIPQPNWAKELQQKIIDIFRGNDK